MEARNLCYLIRCTSETAFKAKHQILNSDLGATFVWIYEELTDALEFSLEILLVSTVGDVEEEVRVFALKKLRGWDGSTDTHHRSRAICSWLPSGQ